MSESICYQCKNYVKWREIDSMSIESVNRICSIIPTANLDGVSECSHFFQKENK